MKTRILTTLLLALAISYNSTAQTHKKTHKKTAKKEVTKKHVAPEDKKPMDTFKDPLWAPKGYHSEYHVYFPDYETFYDPHRGYVTRDKDSWVASPSMPLFLSNKELNKQPRIQILKDISLDMRPELNYPRYMKMYPADPNGRVILAPVPKAAGQSGTP